MKNLIKKLVLLTLLVSVVISCKNEQTSESEGEVIVKLTDAPFPFAFVTEANIAIAKLEIKNSEGTYVTVFEASGTAAVSYNLLDYSNGATATVDTNTIEAGTYTHAKVTLAGASVNMNGSIDVDGTDNTIFNNFGADAEASYEYPIYPILEVEAGEESNILIDVDVNETFKFSTSGFPLNDWISIITDITGCTFDPAIRICDLDKSGTITGSITSNGTPIENANVTLTVNGVKIAAHSKADGSYTFIGIHEGVYELTASVDGQDAKKVSVTVTGTDTAEGDFRF
jgi:hypothetical protein